MILQIDTTSRSPVYAQIVDQVKRAVASGTLRAGEALPSLRETSIHLRVNPLTVTKAYKLLEQEGIIVTQHGRGSFVSSNAAAPAGEFGRQTLERELDSVLLDACNLKVSFDEVRRILEERMAAANDGFAAEVKEVRDPDDE